MCSREVAHNDLLLDTARTTSNHEVDYITDFSSNDQPLNSLSLVTTTKEDKAGEFKT